jgi:gamma-glutamyl:cysteine ligase YbdK (ATP-grasp superfamily)
MAFKRFRQTSFVALAFGAGLAFSASAQPVVQGNQPGVASLRNSTYNDLYRTGWRPQASPWNAKRLIIG